MTTQTEAQRLALALSSTRRWNELTDDDCDKAAAELRRLEAANAELLEALAGVLKIGRGSSGRIIIEGWQEEAIRAALKKHGGQS